LGKELWITATLTIAIEIGAKMLIKAFLSFIIQTILLNTAAKLEFCSEVVN